MHARRSARDVYFSSRADDAFFTPHGDVQFADAAAARRFVERINAQDRRTGDSTLRASEIAAMALVHELMHALIEIHRSHFPESFVRLSAHLGERLGAVTRGAPLAFLNAFPTPAVYTYLRGEGGEAPERVLETGETAALRLTEELLLLWLVNENPAYEPVRWMVSDRDMPATYRSFVEEARRFLEDERSIGPRGENLIDLLLAPSRQAPHSIFSQLRFIETSWGKLGLDVLSVFRRIAWAEDVLSEEGRYFLRGGPGPGEPLLDAMRFAGEKTEPKNFSPDLDWMPSVVLIAKTVFVWLDQLSKKYGRAVHRLDDVPDEELDLLATRGFTGLWLIGIFERSRASRRIKQLRGDAEAVASAYSLDSYHVAEELGGYPAYQTLRDRAWARGIRLAADMVPNHVGIDSEWVLRHPEWFLQTQIPPFPSYRFGGPDLCDDRRAGVFIEEGYWNRSDAAVVFRRHERSTGEDRFLYHGNDGTSMPWNDTAQLDYTKAEVRQAVIETILHVARLFPIIRFDAAMTLAKRHYKRLWFPFPGAGDGIPSRSDWAMTQEEFDQVFPVEFWREVVDTVAIRAPDTLLLAEAFWMMEGYFVRSLGMHRVYNSAFMNMLKREENEKYRQTIKNVLDFDPEILKRFVNFMNNPDEETAIAQFGSDDKYFGVCVLMTTMPGLPMFGHGQVEGLHEKYGMEYRRAKWDETPNQGLVARHEREIFPLLKKRYLFSGVASFALYDFVTPFGAVDEDVFAYSNRAGNERAVVLFNNRFKIARGRIHGSVPTRREDGSLHSVTLGQALGLAPEAGDWLVLRDATGGLEYLRPMDEVARMGLSWELSAFSYHVLTSFRAVNVTESKPYDRLAAELDGRGVPSIERAVTDLHHRPVHRPIREMLSDGHLAYLGSGWDVPNGKLIEANAAALEERLGHFADGLSYMTEAEIDRGPAFARARQRYEGVLRIAYGATRYAKNPTSDDSGIDSEDALEARPGSSREPARAETPRHDVALLLALLQIESVLDLASAAEPGVERPALVERWELALPILDAFAKGRDEHEAKRRTALLLLALTLPTTPLRETLRAAFSDARARTFLGAHEAGGTEWIIKERLEELARWISERDAAAGRVSIALAHRQTEDAVRMAEREGYRARAIEAALAERDVARPRGDGT